MSLMQIYHRKHRQFIKENLGQGSSRTRVEKIMALLVESGGLYCIFWVSAPGRSGDIRYNLSWHSLPQIILISTYFTPINVFGSPNALSEITLSTNIQLAVSACINVYRDALNTGLCAQGVYPTGVLVLVSLEKTIWDSRGSVVGYSDDNTTHLDFAAGPGIVSQDTASRHRIGIIQLCTEMRAVEFERDDYRDSIECAV